jgi:sugar/nucleoside kinase (ribokinase family)
VILVDEREGERIVLWYREPALAIRPNELGPGVLAGARLLHVDDVDEETAINATRTARAAGVPVTSDIDRCTDRTDELMMAVTVPIFGEQALGALTGEADPERALRKLRRRHDGWLCVTRGARGALLLENDRLHESPARPVKAVDTTGAGDVFRGAFIVAMLRGDAPADILRFACAAAAVSCTRAGAISSVPTLAEVEALATKGTKTA